MNKSQRRQIEREFYNYKNNKQMAAEYVASHALDGFAVDYSRERVQTSYNNGTENKIIGAICKEETAYKWCVVFQKTMDKFRWELKYDLISKRYIEKQSPNRTCYEIRIGRRTYDYWVDEILVSAFLWADYFGLL
nr:MAG TPA: hypothetical protein [Caudoviricetes sp.]